MDSSLKYLLYIIIVFGFLAIGTETYRIIKINMDFQESIEIITEDSIELAIIDRYRQDHISIMDKDMFQENFYYFIKDKYKLDNSLTPIGESVFSGPVIITKLDMEEGEFRIVDNKPEQLVNPSCRVIGKTTIRPMILGFNIDISIKFDVFSENKRVD